MIKAILFDLDETIVDRAATIGLFLPAQYTRLNLQQPSYAVYRERFEQLDEHGYADRRSVFQALQTEFALPYSVDELLTDFRQHIGDHCQLFADAHQVLQQLRQRGYQLGIISNGSSQAQRAKLRGTNLSVHFDVILISEEEKVKKPDAEIFLRAAAKLAVKPEECIFVGDNPEADMLGAMQVGMQTVWRKGHLPWPAHLAITPAHRIEALSELLAIRF